MSMKAFGVIVIIGLTIIAVLLSGIKDRLDGVQNLLYKIYKRLDNDDDID